MVFCGVRRAQEVESCPRRRMGFLQESMNACCMLPLKCKLIITGSAVVLGDFVMQMVLPNYYIVKLMHA